MTRVPIHTSGHASIQTMKYLVNELQPKRIIPVHTNYPEAFQEIFSGFSVVEAEDGVIMLM